MDYDFKLDDELKNKYKIDELDLNKQPSFIEGFTTSALSSAAEFFTGAEPPKSVQDFRENNPTAGLLSEVVTPISGYFTAYKASQKIKKLDNAINKVVRKRANKVTASATDAVLRTAPVEVARLGGTAIVNPDKLPDVAIETLFNVGIEGAVGGALGLLKAGGKIEPSFKEVKTGEDLRKAPQQEIYEIKTKLENNEIPEDMIPQAKGQIANLEFKIRNENTPKNGLFGELVTAPDNKALAKIYKQGSSPKKGIKRFKLIKSYENFKDPVKLREVMVESGLYNNLEYVQYPVYMTFANKRMAQYLTEKTLNKAGMVTFDKGTLVTKEKDGLYIVAKKITGEIDKVDKTDEWVFFKTSDLSRFVDGADSAEVIADRMKFLRRDNLEITKQNSAIIIDSIKTRVKNTPIKDFREIVDKYGYGRRALTALAKRTGFPVGEAGSSFAVQRSSAILQQFLTPKLYQGKSSPLAKYILGHVDLAFKESKHYARRIINGEFIDESAKGISRIFKDSKHTDEFKGKRSIRAIINSLTKEELGQMREIADTIAGELQVDNKIKAMIEAGEISPNLGKALLDLNAHDTYIVKQINAAQTAADRYEFKPLAGHLMLTRVWQGDYRAIIKNDADQIVYVASGSSPEEANNIANAMIKLADKNNLTFTTAQKVDAMDDLDLAGRIAFRSREFKVLSAMNTKLRTAPQSFKKRYNIGGYVTDYSRKNMIDRISSHINERLDYIARLGIDTALESELEMLRELEPEMFAVIADRLRQVEGKTGAVAQVTNMAVDKLLKPALGRNSATKLSSILNETFYHLQLGMGNLAFPTINALTFIQTVTPEIAFLTNASNSRIIRDYYDVFLMGGSDLKPRGNMGILSPMKMLARSFRKMAKASDDIEFSKMLDQARAEGVIDPQLLEEFIGKSSEMSTTVSDVLRGDEPLVNLIRTWSSFLPSKTERFARGHAFTTGYLVAKDIMRLDNPEMVYQFARKFTERTMYNYATQDRATLMTGPLGRTFGLFKNWQIHYIHSMFQFANEGFSYGNWSPLLWQMAGTSAIGGVGALPLYAVADKFSQIATNESLMMNAYEAFGGTNADEMGGSLADGIYLGLPALFGVSLSGNASAPFNDPIRDAGQLASFPQWDRMVALGKAVGEAIDHTGITGEHPISTPQVRDKFVAALAPKVIARSFQLTADNALKTLRTSNMVMGDLTLAERMLYNIGFTPRRLGLTYDLANELRKDKLKERKQLTAYGRKWADAQAEMDWDTLEQIRKDAMFLGLDISSITKSANSIREKQTTPSIEMRFSDEALMRARQLGMLD